MGTKKSVITHLEKIVEWGKQKIAEKKGELNDEGAIDFAGVAITLGGAVVAIMVVVILCGNLDTATLEALNSTSPFDPTGNTTSTWYTLLSTVSTYGSTGVTLLAVGLIVMGAMAILWIIR